MKKINWPKAFLQPVTMVIVSKDSLYSTRFGVSRLVHETSLVLSEGPRDP